MPSMVAIEPSRVFVDSGGFIALHVEGDAQHDQAVVCRDRTLIYSHLYTSAAVISETISHIQRDNLLDEQNLQDVIDDFLIPGKWNARILPIEEQDLMRALKMVRQRHDPRFSLVDATNLVLMEKNEIDMIFSFDSMFDGQTIMRGYTPRFINRIGP